MSLIKRLRKIRIRDFQFNNVSPSVAYTFIIFGMIHFIILGSNLIALYKVQWYNWGIFVGLGLDGTFQLEMTQILMWIDGGLALWGLYLLKHLEPEEKKKKFRSDYGENDFKDKNDLQ